MAPSIISVKRRATAVRGPSAETEDDRGDEGTAPLKDEVAQEDQGEEEDDGSYLDRLFLAKKKNGEKH